MKHDHAAACRFFTPEDACRVALAAYYAAGASNEPPSGEPWEADGISWDDGSGFLDWFLYHVARKLVADAIHGGRLPRSVGNQCSPAASERGILDALDGAGLPALRVKGLPPAREPADTGLCEGVPHA